MPPQERTISIKISNVLTVLGVIASLWLLWSVRDVIALLVVALFLSALMHPAVRWGAKRKIPKSVMVILIYLFLFGLLATAFALILPTLTNQISQLSQTIGNSLTFVSSAVDSVREFTQQYGLAQNFSSSISSLQDNIGRAASGLFVTLTDVFGGLVGLVLVIVMAYYMVVQEEEAVRAFHNLVPKRYQNFIVTLLTHVEEKIGKWLSGQLVLSLIIATLYFIGLISLGLDGALALALFAGFMEFIPYLGPFLAGIPIILVALTISPLTALLTLALVVVIQQVENQIIVPKVMQKVVGLNPLVSIVALLIGAKLFGVVGALLAIPTATALSVVLSEFYARDRK
ncbi:MAG: AI-2E family transporter [bacterium]|nr:AI-2E family transporter [bacterium]